MYEIINETNKNIENIEDIKKVIDFACKVEDLDNVIFNIIIVDNKYIKNINKKYRNIDKETDVISFALEDDNSVVAPNNIRILGDIYVSLDKAKEQAKEYNHSLKRELTFLVIHGFYHLLGYDHMNKDDEKLMIAKQKEVLDNYEQEN